MAFWKESMINRLSNLINRNCSAAKISQVLCSSTDSTDLVTMLKNPLKLAAFNITLDQGPLDL